MESEKRAEVRRRVGSRWSNANPVFNLRPVCPCRVSEQEAFSQKAGDHAALGANFSLGTPQVSCCLDGNITKKEEEEPKGVESH